MLDPKTGAISFDKPEWTTHPSLSRAQFLASAIGQRAKLSVENEPYCSWAVSEFHSGELTFGAQLFFKGQSLQVVILMCDEPPFSWKDYSHEKEMQRKGHHDAWLSTCLRDRRRFRWGSAASIFDERAGFSLIHIRYGLGGMPFNITTLAFWIIVLSCAAALGVFIAQLLFW